MDDGHVRNWVMVRTKVSEGVPKRTALCSFLFGREEGMGSSEGGVQICSGRVERRDGVIAWVRWSAVVLLCLPSYHHLGRGFRSRPRLTAYIPDDNLE